MILDACGARTTVPLYQCVDFVFISLGRVWRERRCAFRAALLRLRGVELVGRVDAL